MHTELPPYFNTVIISMAIMVFLLAYNLTLCILKCGTSEIGV